MLDEIIKQLRRDEGVRYCGSCASARMISDFAPKGVVCRACKKATGARYYAKHRDRLRAMHMAGYYANKQTRRATQKRYETKVRELCRVDPVRHAKELISLAKTRAKKFDLPFTITYLDIPIPAVCPVLGIPLRRNRRKMGYDSATVDRIEPSKGYVQGNVIVISLKANAIKNNGTPDEILKVGLFFKNLGDKQ